MKLRLLGRYRTAAAIALLVVLALLTATEALGASGHTRFPGGLTVVTKDDCTLSVSPPEKISAKNFRGGKYGGYTTTLGIVCTRRRSMAEVKLFQATRSSRSSRWQQVAPLTWTAENFARWRNYYFGSRGRGTACSTAAPRRWRAKAWLILQPTVRARPISTGWTSGVTLKCSLK